MADTQSTIAPEEWRDIPGYESLYQVSSIGRVRRLHRTTGRNVPPHKLLTPTLVNGYKIVHLSKNGEAKKVAIHRLVALAFHGPCPSGMHVNHIIPNKLDNRAENLEYVTPRENILHASRLGLMPTGKRNGTHTKPETRATGERHSSKTHPEGILRGQRHPMAKLTEADVRDIRRRYANGNVYLKDLATEYCVTFGLIGHIVNRRIWKHVTD